MGEGATESRTGVAIRVHVSRDCTTNVDKRHPNEMDENQYL